MSEAKDSRENGKFSNEWFVKEQIEAGSWDGIRLNSFSARPERWGELKAHERAGHLKRPHQCWPGSSHAVISNSEMADGSMIVLDISLLNFLHLLNRPKNCMSGS